MHISFIHIPKTGGPSIRTLCNIPEQTARDDKLQYHSHEVDVFDPTIKNQLIVLREPISRFKSIIRFLFEGLKIDPYVDYLIDNDIITAEKWVNVLSNKEHSQHDKLMDMMHDKDILSPHSSLYMLASPQSRWINNPRYVLLFENLEEEFKLFTQHHKLSSTSCLPRLNATAKNEENDNLSQTSIEYLKNFYKDDCKLYRYYSCLPIENRIKQGLVVEGG